MSAVGLVEKVTQAQVLALLTGELGYRPLRIAQAGEGQAVWSDTADQRTSPLIFSATSGLTQVVQISGWDLRKCIAPSAPVANCSHPRRRPPTTRRCGSIYSATRCPAAGTSWLRSCPRD